MGGNVGVTVKKNIFEYTVKYFDSDATFSNNIFLREGNGYTSYSYLDISYFDGVHFNNNIVLSNEYYNNTEGKKWGPLWGFENCILRNNIFLYDVTEIPNNNDAQNNKFGIPQYDIFIDQEGFLYNYSHDYNVKSVGINAGTDLTDIGIYGTSEPFKVGSLPPIPHIKSAAFESKVENETQMLNVTISVRAQEK